MRLIRKAIRDNFIRTAEALRGAERRLFMARTVRSLGHGGQRFAETELGWNRVTVRKGLHELRSGIRCHDHFAARGRRPAEHRLPNLLSDIRSIVQPQSQTDPQFRNQRLYTRLTAASVREVLIKSKGYSRAEVPAVRTISNKLSMLGFKPARVAKCRPKKS
jgi:hypothetical protein